MVWVAVASALVVLILLIAFILQNQEYVQVKFLACREPSRWASPCSSPPSAAGCWWPSPAPRASSSSGSPPTGSGKPKQAGTGSLKR